jgi:hypothetical protein
MSRRAQLPRPGALGAAPARPTRANAPSCTYCLASAIAELAEEEKEEAASRVPPRTAALIIACAASRQAFVAPPTNGGHPTALPGVPFICSGSSAEIASGNSLARTTPSRLATCWRQASLMN